MPKEASKQDIDLPKTNRRELRDRRTSCFSDPPRNAPTTQSCKNEAEVKTPEGDSATAPTNRPTLSEEDIEPLMPWLFESIFENLQHLSDSEHDSLVLIYSLQAYLPLRSVSSLELSYDALRTLATIARKSLAYLIEYDLQTRRISQQIDLEKIDAVLHALRGETRLT